MLDNNLDLSDNLELCSGPEVDALLTQQETQVARDVTARHVHAHDAVRHCETFVDGNLNIKVQRL